MSNDIDQIILRGPFAFGMNDKEQKLEYIFEYDREGKYEVNFQNEGWKKA